MKSQKITTGGQTYTITYPTTSATIASTGDVALTAIESAPSISGSFSKNVYVLNQGVGFAPDNGLNVDGQQEKYITVPTDGTYWAELTIASFDPQQSWLSKDKIKFTVVDGVYSYVEGWEEQQNQTWIKSPDGNFPPNGANTWLIVDNSFGTYGIRADIYGVFEQGVDYRGQIVVSREIDGGGGGGGTSTAPQAFANEVGSSWTYLQDTNANQIFEQVTGNGRYLHKIKVIGRSAIGGETVFYAEPVFEMQYNNGVAKFVAGYNKNILLQGNSTHDVIIEFEQNGFRVRVNGPDTGTTDFTGILELPEFVSNNLLNIPTIYQLQAGQFDLSPAQEYPIDLVFNNGALSGGVLDVEELPDGTYDMVANVKSQQYPQDFEVNVTKRFTVSDSFATVTDDPTYDDYQVVVDNTDGASASIQYGEHPVSGAIGIFVTATGYSTASKFEGTLTVTPVTV